MKKNLLTLMILLWVGASQAQFVDTLSGVPSLNQRHMQVLFQQWLLSPNAAGLAFSNVNKGGLTSFERLQSGGDHHRVQEGSLNQGMRFFSEGYSRFNDKVFARGQFSFNKNLEQDRAWSDVINTYNGNPFIYGSSVRGNYDLQQFDMNVSIYHAAEGRWNFGLTLDYHVADIARQRDPRSRSYMADYALIPSVVFSLNTRSRVGGSAFYRYQKEDMPNLSTVQTDPNLQYYTFSGLQHANGRIGGYKAFRRQFLSDHLGGDMQYHYDHDRVKMLVSAGFAMQWENTLGDKKQSPGSWDAWHYNFMANLIVTGKDHVHNALLTARFKDGGAHEYRQSLHSERDPLTGTSTEYWKTDYIYNNRYVVKTSDLKFSWKRYALRSNQKEYNWSAGVVAAYESFSNIYYLPRSEYAASKVFGGLEGSFYLIDSRHHRISIEPLVKAGVAHRVVLNLDHETEISEMILGPDFDFHQRNTLEISGSVLYTFPMAFSRRTPMSGYARLGAANLFTNSAARWRAFSISIGLLTIN